MLDPAALADAYRVEAFQQYLNTQLHQQGGSSIADLDLDRALSMVTDVVKQGQD